MTAQVKSATPFTLRMPLHAFPISLSLVQSLYAVDDDLERRKPLG